MKKKWMKRMAVSLLAGMLSVGSSAVSVCATEPDLTMIGMEQMKEDLYEGIWFPITEAGTQIFLPVDFMEYPDEEDVENGRLYVLEGPVRNTLLTVTIDYVSAEKLGKKMTPSTYLNDILQDEKVTDAMEVAVNGFHCVTYDISREESDDTVLAFFGADGGLFVINASPYTDSTRAVISNIFFSFSEK